MLDPLLDPAFDRLTRLAAALVGAAEARVHLGAAGRLRLRSAHPCPTGAEAGEPSLWTLLADQVVRLAQPLVLQDLQAWRPGAPGDVQISEAGAAYIGVPLREGSAGALGVLAVLDTRPRPWSTGERDRLVDLAVGVMAEVDLWLLHHPQLQTARGVALPQRGRPPRGGRGRGEAEPMPPARGELQALADELQAARRAAESERLRRQELMDLFPSSYLITDPAGVIKEANRATADLLGRPAGGLVGRRLTGLLAGRERRLVLERLERLGAEGEGWGLEVTARIQASGRRVLVTATASTGTGPRQLHWQVREDAGAAAERGGPPASTEQPVPAEDPAGPSGTPRAPRAFAAIESGAAPSWNPDEADLADHLRGLVTGALHVGSLQVGDRLPSIRKVALSFGVTSYAALRAYESLEAAGLVERRERSGIYVAALERPLRSALPETGLWLADVLTQACAHRLKVPHLPDLIRRWTAVAPIRCVCVESCLDDRTALCAELSQQFGLVTTPVPLEKLDPATGELPDAPGELRDADLLVTTAYHAAELRPLADALDKPLLVAAINPLTSIAVENHLREKTLTVVCADRVFGERMLTLYGKAPRDQVHVVLADDAHAVDGLDRAEPVLLTLAARQRLLRPNFRLVAPLSPAFSLEFARRVAETLVQMNIEAERA